VLEFWALIGHLTRAWLQKKCKSRSIYDAGWSSLVARRAHNPEVVGSNPTPATMPSYSVHEGLLDLSKPFSFLDGFKWVQNLAQLPCDFGIVLARNMCVHPECEPWIAVS
jgi:hypothetical protein